MKSKLLLVTCFYDKKGNIWITDTEGICMKPVGSSSVNRFDINQVFSMPFIAEQRGFSVELFNEGQDFFCYKNQKEFFVFSSDYEVIYNFQEEYNEIINQYIHKVYFDRQGNIWVTTNFGVYKIRLTPTHFTNYLSVPLAQYNNNNSNSIRGLHLNDNQLWVNTIMTEDYIVNTATKEARLLPKNPTVFQKDHIFRPVLHLKDDEYMTFGEELVHYKNYEPIANYVWKKEAYINFAWSLHQDAQQKIWIGTHEKGLATITDDSLVYFNDYNEFSTFASTSIYHFLQWDKTHTLIASTSGIYVLHNKKGIIQHFSTEQPDGQKILFDVIYHIHRDLDEPDVLWVATGGGGLLKLKYNVKTGSIESQEQITTINGLSNNVIYAVYEDQEQNLWMSSDLGIIRYHKISKQSKTYTTQDGLPYNEFNRTAHHQAVDGQLFFGSMNGVTSFYPNELLASDSSETVVFRITNVEQFIGRKNQLENRTVDFYDTKKIVLAPSDKFINLKFALLEYRDASQVQYSYQLSGQGDEWFYLNDNQLRLSGLPYGKLTLKIRAQGISNPSKASILEVSILVRRPFYLRWWFILSTLIIVALGVFYFFRRRTEQLRIRQAELEEVVKRRTQKIKEDKAIIEKDKAVIEQQAEELRQLDKVKSQFFANVSHELRTPLTLMLAPIENTLNENQLTNKAYTNLLLAQKNGQRLNRMINEILDLTKLEAGKLEVQMDKTVFYTFLKNIIVSFESVANQKEIDFIFDYQGNKYLQVLLDQGKVEIILLNLLSNAFKFTQRKGQIELIVKDEGQFIEIHVSDTGRGIHSDDLSKIFNRFYQSKKKGQAEGGTGIGLALTKEFVELLGGTISVKSEWGKGATFSVQLPKKEVISKVNDEAAILIQNEALQTNNRLEKYKQKTPTHKPSNPSTTILLVEDNNDLRYFIESILSTEYHIITAENGQVALEKLPNINCQLIISDVMMPIMDGYELLKKVKSDERFNHIPVIMLTARSAFDDKMKALRIGVDDYLTKPFVEEELFIRIDNLLKNATNRKQALAEASLEEEIVPVENQLKTQKSRQPKPKVITPELQEWLAEVESKLLEHIGNNSYTIDSLSSDMAIGKRQLARRIKELVGMTPKQYIKTIRYTKARELLENKTYPTVKAVAYSVGFKDVIYFSRKYRAHFGKFPSEYF